MASQSQRPDTSRVSGGAVSLGDLRSSLSTTRTTFTRIRTRRFIDREAESAVQPDFITLISLVCNIYREYEQDLVPIQQFHPDREKYADEGHACVVSQRAISTIAASNVKRGTTDSLAQEIVVKRTRESVLTQNSAGLRSFLNEIRIRTHPSIRNHPNIVKFKGVAWDFEDDEATQPRPLLLEELAPQRSLEAFWRQYDFVCMTFQSKVDLCIDVADGLAALHASHIVHGDVKPDNILIFPRVGHQDAFMAKLTDFGHSVSAHENLRALPALTPPWAAPEVLDNSDLNFQGMISSDVYSYGLVMLSIMIGRSYHRDLEDLDVMKRDDTMFEGAMRLVEKEDRQDYDSDFDLDTIRLLLRHSLRRKASKRSLRRCIRVLTRYKASQTGIHATKKTNYAVEQPHILGLLDVSQMVYIGYRSLVRCSYQLRSRIVQGLTAIAMNDNDPRQPAAAWELSICHFSGFGTPKDYSISSRWLVFAADNDIPAAKMFKKKIHEAMNMEPPILLETSSRRVEPAESAIPQLDRIPETLDHGHQTESDSGLRAGGQDSREDSLEAHNDVLDENDTELPQIDEDSESDLSLNEDEQNCSILPENIIRAIMNSDLKTLNTLILRDPEVVNSRDSGGNTPLLIAAQHSSFKVMQVLLKFDVLDASICNRFHESVLHHLSGFKDNEIQFLIPRLLARKADVCSDAIPNRSESSLTTFPAGVDSCPVLRAILSGNLFLLRCLLEETHKAEGSLSCRICEAGSRFRRIVAVAISTFRSEAVVIMLNHVKKFKDVSINLSKIKVWSSRELIPLWKIPFQSLFVTAIDLPDSFFRAISFGRHHKTSLELTLQFLLTNLYNNPEVLLLEMLKEAVAIDNYDAVEFVLSEGQKRHLEPSWWLSTSTYAFLKSPFFIAIDHGYRNIFNRLCTAYPAVFQNLPIVEDDDLPGVGAHSGKNDTPEWKKKLVTMSSVSLSLAVTAPHQDLYFVDYVLKEAKRKHLIRTPTRLDDKVAGQSTVFLAQAILTSSFSAAAMICKKHPETWRHSLELRTLTDKDKILDTHLAIAFDNGNEFLEPITSSLIYISGDFARRRYLLVPQYVFLLGSYDQCLFVLNHYCGSSSQLLGFSQSIGLDRLRFSPAECENGYPRCFYNRLHPDEFHILLIGNIVRNRRDRHLLWKLIAAQISLGQSRSTYYLHLALQCCNNQAVNQLLDLGWRVDGVSWAPWTNHLWFAKILQTDAKKNSRNVGKMYVSGRWKKPQWSALDTHQGLFLLYAQQELKIYEEHEKNLKQNCKTLEARGGTLPWPVKLHRQHFRFCVLGYFILYAAVLPPIIAWVISPHWKCETYFRAVLGWSWLWSILAAVNSPVYLINLLPYYGSFEGLIRMLLGLAQTLLQHLVPLILVWVLDCDKLGIQGIQYFLPFSIIMAEIAIVVVGALLTMAGAGIWLIAMGCMFLFDEALTLLHYLRRSRKGWSTGSLASLRNILRSKDANSLQNQQKKE